MKILITGVAGLVGRAAARELMTHGHKVRGLDVLPAAKDLRDAGLDMVYADVTDSMTMMRVIEGSDAVIHCAAYPTPHGRTPGETLRVNVIGTQNVLDASAANGVKMAVITSSIGALGFSFPRHPCPPDYFPVDSAHPRRPQDAYGLSKLMNEESAVAATRAHGLTTVVIRPPWVGDFVHMAQNGWLRRRIEESGKRRDSDLWGYVDIGDLARAYRLVVESDVTGHHTCFITADDVISTTSAADLVRAHFPERTGDIERLAGNTLYDIGAARDLFGFTPEFRWRDVIDDL